MGIKRNTLHEMVKSGELDAETIARDLLNWLTEDECGDFAHANGIDLGLDDDDDDDNDDPDRYYREFDDPTELDERF